jgi:hypothetical protein
VVSVDPLVEGLKVGIVGGDSFVELTAPPDHTVIVSGYQGEPYLRFSPDGMVEENEATTTAVLNQSRYGRSTAGTNTSPDAPPGWKRVATNGSYAWHDHRSHWMSPRRPPGKHPGDVVVQGVIPLVVDGNPVSVLVETTWLAAPSPVPAAAGAIGAAVLLVAIFVAARRRVELTVAAAAAVVAVLALVAGVAAYTSVPVVTGRRFAEWALPAVAVVLGLIGALIARRRPPLAAAFATVASLQLLGWGWWRRLGLSRATIPTDLAAPLDRFVTAAALAVGVLGAVAAGWTLVRPLPPMSPPQALPANESDRT